MAAAGFDWQLPPRRALVPVAAPKRERSPYPWTALKAARGNATYPGEAGRSRGGAGYDSEGDQYDDCYGWDRVSRGHEARRYGDYGNKENFPSPNAYHHERGRYESREAPPMGNHAYRRPLRPSDEFPVHFRGQP